jgi:hypothetical protein
MTELPTMATPDSLFELRLTRNHTVIVLVSVVDRRIVPALRFVSRLGCSDTRALHVSIDPHETRRLATDWMNLGLSWLPLHVRDAPAEGLPAAVRAAVREAAVTTEGVTVVLPELDFPRWWHPVLHRCRARRIAAQLQSLPGVTAVIVPFSVPPSGPGSAGEMRSRDAD